MYNTIILRILHLKDDETEIHGNWLSGQMDRWTQFSLFSDQGVSPGSSDSASVFDADHLLTLHPGAQWSRHFIQICPENK